MHLTIIRAARIRRATLPPVAAVVWIGVLSVVALSASAALGTPGWLLTWLSLGLTAGYALSGSV
jgi:hypothetical protein